MLYLAYSDSAGRIKFEQFDSVADRDAWQAPDDCVDCVEVNGSYDFRPAAAPESDCDDSADSAKPDGYVGVAVWEIVGCCGEHIKFVEHACRAEYDGAPCPLDNEACVLAAGGISNYQCGGCYDSAYRVQFKHWKD